MNIKMGEYQFHPALMAHVYLKISRELRESPDESITWLENLSYYHYKKVKFST